MSPDVLFLRAGVAIPVLYFGSVGLAALLYPGFSFVRQFASELGADGATHPQVLNAGIILVGVMTLAATVGFWRVLPRLGARPVPARLTCYVVGMFGVAMVFAGIYPHPDWRHSGAGLGIPVLAGPALLATALWKRRDLRPLRNYLLVTNALMVAMLFVYVSATHSGYVGLCQLLYSLLAIPWMGVSALVLSRRVSAESLDPQPAPAY
jgi:hypothetical membrane protein